jgi:hypothetical protein
MTGGKNVFSFAVAEPAMDELAVTGTVNGLGETTLQQAASGTNLFLAFSWR